MYQGYHPEDVPFQKIDFEYALKVCNVSSRRLYDAHADCS